MSLKKYKLEHLEIDNDWYYDISKSSILRFDATKE